jgi:ribosome-interacting GTPase 1
MIIGPTKAGRSSILRALTNAQPAVAAYEHTTQLPVPGMLQYEDVQFQLVELPAPQASESDALQIQPEAIELIRNTDGLMIVLDLSSDPVRQFRSVTAALEEVKISVQHQSTRVEVVREKGSGEVRIATAGIKNALVRIYGNVSLDDVEDAILENVTLYKPCLVVGNKSDLSPIRDIIDELQAETGSIPTIATSCLIGTGLANIGAGLFHCLGVIRVYTKEPNQTKPSEHPFVVRAGTTVGDLARAIHSDLANRYRYSRIWGPTSKFAGERVGPEHVLGDMDLVEIHTD